MDTRFPRREALKFGWETAKKNIRFFIVVLGIVMLISLLFSIVDSSFTEDDVMPRFIVGIVSWVVSSITAIGLIRIALNFVEQKKSTYADLFKHYNRTVNYMAGSILYGLIVAAGLVLLIIPGIYLAIRFRFYNYEVVEKNSGPIEALKASWKLTENNAWQLFVYGLVVTGINILGLLCLVVGLFWTVPMTQVSTAYIYKHLAKK